MHVHVYDNTYIHTVFSPMCLLCAVASLLTMNPREVRKALTTATVVAHGETILKPMTIDQAMDARDATAKVGDNIDIVGTFIVYVIRTYHTVGIL